MNDDISGISRLSVMGWECAYVLLAEFPERLSLAEHVVCQLAVFSSPERCRDPGPVIALYLRIAGVRT